MSMPTARILLVLIFVRAKLDTVEMEKLATVRMVHSTWRLVLNNIHMKRFKRTKTKAKYW